MATDARGHTVPAASDHPARATLLNLSSSIRDVAVVANTTARGTLITNLTSAGIGPTTSNPVLVFRTDSLTYEASTDGTNWTTLARRTDSTYVPVWGSSGTQPTLGNGTIVGTYSQDDKFIDFEVALTLGTTSTVGTGSYTLTLPVAPVGSRLFLPGVFFDSSLGKVYLIAGQWVSGTTLGLVDPQQPAVSLGATAPVIPANLDSYTIRGRYRWA
jgi:hypothetical protein